MNVWVIIWVVMVCLYILRDYVMAGHRHGPVNAPVGVAGLASRLVVYTQAGTFNVPLNLADYIVLIVVFGLMCGLLAFNGFEATSKVKWYDTLQGLPFEALTLWFAGFFNN